MRVCLVNPPWTVHRIKYAVNPPLSVLSIATVLQRAGEQVTIVDLQRQLELRRLRADASIYQESARRIDDAEPDMVGITAYTISAPIALRLAQVYKKTMGTAAAPVVLGGPVFHSVAREVMERFVDVDYIVRGEGEESIRELVHTLKHRAPVGGVRGLVWRRPNGEVCVNPDRPPVADLDTLPFPDYGLLKVEEYFPSNNLAAIDTGRGCFNRCPFCHTTRFWGGPKRSYRKHSPQAIVGHMEKLCRDWGVTRFLFTHDSFVDSAEELRQFRDLMAAHQLQGKIQYTCSAVLTRLDRETVALLADTGCNLLVIGVESGSPGMREKIGKKIDIKRLEEVVAACRSKEISLVLSFVIGLPGETRADLEATMKLALAMNRAGTKSVLSLLALHPDTPFYEQCRNRLEYLGLFPTGAEIQEEFDIEDLVRDHPDVFPQYYNLVDELPTTLLFEVYIHGTRLFNRFPQTFSALCESSDRSLLDGFNAFMDFIKTHGSAADKASLYRKSVYKVHVEKYFPRFVESLDSEKLRRQLARERGE